MTPWRCSTLGSPDAPVSAPSRVPATVDPPLPVCGQGRRLSGHRLRRGLKRAVADAVLNGSDGTPRRVTPHHLRHTYGTAVVNDGISLPALMALLGNVSPEMTPALRQARQPDDPRRLPRGSRQSPPRTNPAAGRSEPPFPTGSNGCALRCSRPASPTACAPATPWPGPAPTPTSANNATTSPTSDFTPILQAQLDDVRALRDDARSRGWDDETARHERVIASLEAHVNRANKRHERDRMLDTIPRAG